MRLVIWKQLGEGEAPDEEMIEKMDKDKKKDETKNLKKKT